MTGKKIAHKTLLSAISEFLRYCTVGGIAFIADFTALVVAQEIFFKTCVWGVYASTCVGFAAGLTVNYVLSLAFVFTNAGDKGKGRSLGAFLVFGLIGLAGLLWTEAGMWFGVEILSWNYKVVKVIVAGAVLLWNYLGRKVLIFNGDAGI